MERIGWLGLDLTGGAGSGAGAGADGWAVRCWLVVVVALLLLLNGARDGQDVLELELFNAAL